MKPVYGEKPLHSYDFHVHTHHSIDSAINPSRITNLAKRSGLKGLAITDHDTGEFLYTPNSSVTGDDTFSYEVDDGIDTSATIETVSVTIY